ncbi:Unknown protein sequence [Pseudomonas syringae pv. aceris]|nr:Unknown protein sequence [Pseudomonas syringae pv. aceris]
MECLLDLFAHCGRRWTDFAALQQPHFSAHFAAQVPLLQATSYKALPQRSS